MGCGCGGNKKFKTLNSTNVSKERAMTLEAIRKRIKDAIKKNQNEG